MNPAPDTTSAGNGGHFDPQQAAALLDQTTQRARRQLEPYPPWLLVIRAVIALVIYGAIWLTVRGQHPYHWPTAAVIPVAVVLGIVNTVATVTVARRATAGVSGRSRLRPADIVLWLGLWIVVFVVMGVLIGARVSDTIVYGIYPATVPLIGAGLVWAGVSATRANWRSSSASITIVAVGTAGLFAGPVGAWLVAGIGICVVLLSEAAFIAWRQRA